MAALAVLLAGAAGEAAAQESAAAKTMKKHVDHWLDPERCPATGLDSNVKELVAQTLPLIGQTVPDQLSAPMKEPRKILVLTADTGGALHAPGAAGLLALFRAAQRKHPGLEFTEVYAVDDVDPGKLSAYDAIVINNVSSANKNQYDFYNKTLPDYVNHGGGLMGTHGAAVIYRGHEEAPFNTLLGGYTTTPQVHPGNHGSAFPIVLPHPDSPLAAAFNMEPQPFQGRAQWLAGQKRNLYNISLNAPAELADELYTFNYNSNADGACRVIAAIDKAGLKERKKAPVYAEDTPDFGYALVWHKPVGKGRVYYTQFGHNYCIHAVPSIARSILDGLQYACGDLHAE